MSDDKPSWYPVLCDAAYCEQLRVEYPETAEYSDEELIDFYDDGNKYSTTWDHLGDAIQHYEPLCDSYLKLEAQLKRAISIIKTGKALGVYPGTLLLSILRVLEKTNEQ